MKTHALLFCLVLSACTNSSPNEASTTSNDSVARLQNDAPAKQSPAEPNPELKPATFFVNPASHDLDVAIVRENTDALVTIDGHYSQAMVPCGPGCLSYWVVDRQTGGIIDLPNGSTDSDVPYDVKGKRGSNIVEVTYGPVGLSGDACTIQKFELNGTKFENIGVVEPAPCP